MRHARYPDRVQTLQWLRGWHDTDRLLDISHSGLSPVSGKERVWYTMVAGSDRFVETEVF